MLSGVQVQHLDDKVRLVDVDIDINASWAPFVHTLELGIRDDHFVTFFITGRSDESLAWVEGMAKDNFTCGLAAISAHNPARYHHDDGSMVWIKDYFPEQDHVPWRRHFHWIMTVGESLSVVLDAFGEGLSDPMRVAARGLSLETVGV